MKRVKETTHTSNENIAEVQKSLETGDTHARKVGAGDDQQICCLTVRKTEEGAEFEITAEEGRKVYFIGALRSPSCDPITYSPQEVPAAGIFRGTLYYPLGHMRTRLSQFSTGPLAAKLNNTVKQSSGSTEMKKASGYGWFH